MSGLIGMGAASIIGAGISAGGGILSGILGNKSSKKQQRAAQAFEAQRIRMMANDAKLAGIHPLAALGVAANYQNPHMGIGDGGFANSIGSAAQSIGSGLTDYAQAKKSEKMEAQAAALAERQFQQRERAMMIDAFRAETDRMLGSAQVKRIQVETANAMRQFEYQNVGAPRSPGVRKSDGTYPGVDPSAPVNNWRRVIGKDGEEYIEVSPDAVDPEVDAWHETKQFIRDQQRDAKERVHNFNVRRSERERRMEKNAIRNADKWFFDRVGMYVKRYGMSPREARVQAMKDWRKLRGK